MRRSLLRSAMIAAGVSISGACWHSPAFAQADDTISISVGVREAIKQGSAREFARHYLNYALHALGTKRGLAADGSGQLQDLELKEFGEDRNYEKEWTRTKAFLARWTLIDRGEGWPACADGTTNCLPSGGSADGLVYHIHASPRVGGVCREFVIAFRGTDGLNDLRSNFRFFMPSGDYEDQYGQVRRHIDVMVKKITDTNCYRSSSRIVAVGHSLGGGLAQLAALVNRRIRQVYAFDSSPVTAERDLDAKVVKDSIKGLRIDHVYNRGEILSYVRNIAGRRWKPTGCNPQVRTVRLNAGGAWYNPFQLHYMSHISNSLLRWTEEDEKVVVRAKPLPRATMRDCKLAPQETLPEEPEFEVVPERFAPGEDALLLSRAPGAMTAHAQSRAASAVRKAKTKRRVSVAAR